MRKTKRLYFKEGDQRGRHTKTHLRNLRLAKKKYRDRASVVITCSNCNAPEYCFVRSSDGDCTVCTICGVVSTQHLFDYDKHTLSLLRSNSLYRPSVPTGYKNRNYFSERMCQFCNTEPRFTLEEDYYILVVYSLLLAKNMDYWYGQNLTKDHFGRIFRILNHVAPEMKFDNRLERWLQAKALITDQDCTVGSTDIAEKLKIYFDVISDTFHTRFKKKFEMHNIPSIDLLCLILLYNISVEALRLHGWYFLTNNILFISQSTYRNWLHILELLAECNQKYKHISKNKKIEFVRQEAVDLFADGFEFIVPDYSVLLDIACSSPEGYTTLRHSLFQRQNKTLNKIYFV